MKQRHFWHWSLLGAGLGLGVLLYWPNISPLPEENPVLVSALLPDEIQHIRIQIPQKSLIELHKNEVNQWLITTPWSLPARLFKVQQLLAYLTTPSLKQWTIDHQPLSEFGLQESAFSIIFNDLNMDVGRITPLQDKRYLRVGNSIHLVHSHTINTYWQPTDFISLYPLGKNPALQLIQTPSYRLQLNAQGQWQTEHEALAQTLFNAWKNLQALSVRIDTRECVATIQVQFIEQTRLQEFCVVAQKNGAWLINPAMHLLYELPEVPFHRLQL